MTTLCLVGCVGVVPTTTARVSPLRLNKVVWALDSTLLTPDLGTSAGLPRTRRKRDTSDSGNVHQKSGPEGTVSSSPEGLTRKVCGSPSMSEESRLGLRVLQSGWCKITTSFTGSDRPNLPSPWPKVESHSPYRLHQQKWPKVLWVLISKNVQLSSTKGFTTG